MVSLGLYNKSQKIPYHKFSIIKDLLPVFGFESPSYMCGDGTTKEIPLLVAPSFQVIVSEIHYNCCGLNICTAAEEIKVKKAVRKYEKEVAKYRKHVALGERVRKKPKTPNFLKDIEDGVLVCSNSKDLTFSVRFLKPQDDIGTEKRILKDYCGEHTCPMINDFGENRKVYCIDGTDFIKTAEKIVEERDISSGRIFSDVDNMVKELLEKFPPQKMEVSPEIA